MMVERLAAMCRRNSLHYSMGFTLIELMVVILILAILVGIAIPVMYVAKNKAADAVCKANYRIGEETSTGTFLGEGLSNYQANWASFMAARERKTTWVLLRRNAARCLMIQISYKYRTPSVRSTTYNVLPNDFANAYGKICIFRGTRNAANTDWVNNSASYLYTTVIALNQTNDRALYTTYNLGAATRSGSFAWRASDGLTSDFRAE